MSATSVDARPRWRGRILGPLVALTVIFGFSVAPSANAQDPSTQGERAQRDQLRQQQASAAGQLDALKATDAELERAVAVLSQNLSVQQGKVTDTTRSAEQARATAERLQAELVQAEGRVTDLQSRARQRAVYDYVHPGGEDLARVLHSSNVNDAEAQRVMNNRINGADADVLDQLRAAREDTDRARTRATGAQAAAEQRQAEAAAEQSRLRAAVDEKAQAEAALQGRISETQREVSSLNQQEGAITAIIQQKESEAAARRAEQARADQAAADQARARAAAQQQADNASRPSASTSGPGSSAAPAPSGSSSGGSPSPSGSGLIFPADGPITSGFGYRWGSLHPGLDIGAGNGAPIRAAKSGTVIYASWMDGYGNMVLIDHGGGFVTGYAHQSQIAVSNGQQVSQGQTIGYVGSTGNSTGAHLHFETRVNGTAVDPSQYL